MVHKRTATATPSFGRVRRAIGCICPETSTTAIPAAATLASRRRVPPAIMARQLIPEGTDRGPPIAVSAASVTATCPASDYGGLCLCDVRSRGPDERAEVA